MANGTACASEKLLPGTPEAPAGHHGFTVTSVAYHQEKQIVVSASTDGKVLVWNADKIDAQDKPLKILDGKNGAVWSVIVVGNFIVCGSESGQIRIWDINGENEKTLTGHTAPVCKLSQFGSNQFVSASRDSKAFLWSLEKEEPLKTLSGHSKGLTDVVVVGGRAATSSLDNTIKVWDLASGENLSTLEGHALQVTCLTAIDDERIASGSADGEIRIWNLSTAKCDKSFKGHGMSVTGLHKVSGSKLASTGWDGVVKIWDVGTGKCVQTMQPAPEKNAKDADGGICASSVLSEDRIVASHFNKQVNVWDCQSGKSLASKAMKGFASAVVTSIDGKGAYLGLSYGEMHKLDVQ